MVENHTDKNSTFAAAFLYSRHDEDSETDPPIIVCPAGSHIIDGYAAELLDTIIRELCHGGISKGEGSSGTHEQ